MAKIQYWSFSWVGYGFVPGSQAGWRVGQFSYSDIVYATPQPVGNFDRGMVVRSLETVVDAQGNRYVDVLLENTGPNIINGYAVNFSIVSP